MHNNIPPPPSPLKTIVTEKGVPETANTCAPAQDNSKEMRVAGHMVAKGVKCITDNCCTVSTVNNNFSKGQSGQKFYRGAGASFNIVVAYGNCGHDANVRPADELGWGVNGVCDGGVLSPEYDGCDVL